MNLRVLGISLLFSLVLLGCKQEVLDFHHFDDNIYRFQDTENYGLATGGKGFYIYYGTMKLPTVTAPAGKFISFTEVSDYPIIELLKKYPVARNKQSIKAAAVQLVIIERRIPGFYTSMDLGNIGNHHGDIK